MPKQYQVLFLGGPADGRRVVFKDKPPEFIKVPVINPCAEVVWNGCSYDLVDHEYRVQSLRGNKSQYFVAMQGNPSGDEVIEALLRGYNKRDYEQATRRV